MTKAEAVRFLILRSIGNFLVLFSLFGVGMTFGPAIFEEIHFHVDKVHGVHYVAASVAQQQKAQTGQFGSLLTNDNAKVLLAPDPFFSIIIPKIGASARVIPNVDPTNESEYIPALQKGVAHAKGSVFPGLIGTTYLFAHSTDSFWDVGRYNAVFYLLKDLAIGDDVYLFFQNQRFNYKVTDVKIIDPSEVNLLTQAQQTDEQLVLQTCWPPGTTWKRLIVVAKPPAQ